MDKMSEETLSVRTTAEDKAKYEAAAKANDKDLSSWVRDTLDASLGVDALKAAVERERERIGLSRPETFHAQLLQEAPQ